MKTLKDIAIELNNTIDTFNINTKEYNIDKDIESLLLPIQIITATYIGKSDYLNAERPIIFIASDDNELLSYASIEIYDDKAKIKLSDSNTFQLNGGIDALDIINILYRLSPKANIKKFLVKRFSDQDINLPKYLDEIDNNIAKQFIEKTNLHWSPLIINQNNKKTPCNCKKWTFCEKDPNDGAKCNSLKSKCKDDCDN